jgi:hypothetical protein
MTPPPQTLLSRIANWRKTQGSNAPHFAVDLVTILQQ